MMKNESDIQAINEAYSNVRRNAVYVTKVNIDYEENIPLGIYSTLEKAQAVALAYDNERKGHVASDIEVYEVNIDEQPSDDEIGKFVWYWHAESKKGIFWGDAEQQFWK